MGHEDGPSSFGWGIKLENDLHKGHLSCRVTMGLTWPKYYEKRKKAQNRSSKERPRVEISE